ncbi:MAG: 1-deoxy-D-xylulose-5-phosphate reductoisomerase [Deltaproteobacteria bacterium]|nr:1-deoxy-D-xylulose-5-phosphate reductoisomerase [Deltaproteobacteria bacterium]
MKRLAILGSTGSIGVNTLDIVRRFPERFEVVSLAAGRNLDQLADQVRHFRPEVVSVLDESGAAELRARLGGSRTRVLWGEEGLVAVATAPGVQTVLSAIVGFAGLVPTLAALQAGRQVALANKEILVVAGKIVTRAAREHGIRIFPVDSEHSAIFQSLVGHRLEDVRRIILTASGGPFLHTPPEALARVTVAEALNHPNWKMGRKITIDSATLMNKGLEVIEAHWLFDMPVEKVAVHVHPQSVVHSMVEYVDGSVMAQLGIPDMRAPISYALSYPERLDLQLPPLNLFQVANLTFFEPDEEKFPALRLARWAAEQGESLPAVLNAANEVAVDAFLNGRVGFLDITGIIRRTMELHEPWELREIRDVFEADAWARKTAQALVEECAPLPRA